MKYSFYSKSDNTKETINICYTDSLENAVIIFASSKQLDTGTFLALFNVIEVVKD